MGRRFSRLAAAFRWGVRLLLIALLADAFYLMVVWPDWKALTAGPVPKSSFIERYELRRGRDPSLPRLRWRTAPFSAMPPLLVRAVILAEDARFYRHGGFDLIAFKEAMSYNLEEGRLALGASTISQQTVKNLFLSPARNPLRKWHELVMTWGMERHLSKRRILEIYLNIAEFGTGLYGARTAAEVYYGRALGELDLVQVAELAATLPGPGTTIRRRARTISSTARARSWTCSCAIPAKPPRTLLARPGSHRYRANKSKVRGGGGRRRGGLTGSCAAPGAPL